MAEVEIKRTNFFDGQFLKQGEFIDMDTYHAHMRKRLNFALFDKSGVLQITPTDLTLEVVAGTQIRVRAGAAIGMRPDLMEGKEIILRTDHIVDLATVPGVVAGDTLIVTIHYDELPTDPSNLGGVMGDTRVKELSPITVHRNTLPGVNATNGEPFIKLGNVLFSSMTIQPPRDVAFLKTALFATAPSLSIAPNVLTAGTSTTITLTSSGGLDLSTLTAGNISISPASNITITSVSNQTPNSATVTLNVGAGASATPARTLTVTIGATTATASFGIAGGMALSSFTGVNEPLADTNVELNGSGIPAGNATLDWTRSGGGTTQQIVVAPNVAPNQIVVPMSGIPDDATTGTVVVTIGSQTANINVVPPAKITSVAGIDPANLATPPTPNLVRRNKVLRIQGFRFFAGVKVTLGTHVTGAAFPNAALAESRTDTELRVFIPNSLAAGLHTLTIETLGGIIRHATQVQVTN